MSSHHMPAAPNAGAWLCAEGPYLDLISNMGNINPGILSPDPKNENIGSRIGQSRSVLLEIKPDGKTWSCTAFGAVAELRDYFKTRKVQQMRSEFSRIYMLEGLDPEYVEAFGSQFGIDPMFFIGQERQELWRRRDLEYHIDDPSSLPSAVRPDKQFRVKYREVREFGPQLTDWRTTCALSGRHIAAIGFNGKLDTVGAVARRMSFCSVVNADGDEDGRQVLL